MLPNSRHPFTLFWLLALLLAPAFARASQPVPITLAATPLYEGNFVQGAWLPIRVALKNSAGDTRVRVQAEAPATHAVFALDVDLPGGASKEVTLYTQPDIGGDHIDIVALRDNAELARTRAVVRTRIGERMLLVASDQPLTLPLPRREQLPALPFLPFSFPLAQLPARAEGLATLTSIVVVGGDATALTGAQRLALTAWVSDGGQLVLGGVPGAASTLNALPADLRPADMGAERKRLPGNALATATGVTTTLNAQLDGVALTPRPGTTVLFGKEVPLVVELRVGQGRVQQLAFAPNDPTLASWAGAPQFWDGLLRPLDPASALTGPPGARLSDVREQALTIALSNLPALDLPQPTLLIGLLIVYFLLIGPGLYLLLRRLDRQLWGWLLIPATTLLFGLITFGLGWNLRASDALVNTISVVEPVAGGGAQAHTLVGVYGSSQASYRIAFDDAIVRPLRSASGRYGAIDGAPGSYAQGAASETVVDVPGWSVRGVVAESTVALPALNFEILMGGDGIKARVQNPLGQPLHDVVMSYGEQLVRLNDIPAGGEAVAAWPSTKEFEAGGLPPQGMTLGYLIYQQAISAGEAAGGVTDRQVALRQTMVDALLSNGARPRDRGPVLVAWLDTSPLRPSITSDTSAVVGGATLLLGRPRIMASGPVRLGPGWLALDTDTGSAARCTAADGAVGVQASSVPLTLTLSLPPELATLAPAKLSLTLAGDKKWPNAGVPTRLYNWQSARWDEQSFDGPGDLLVTQPERYMRAGRVLVQLDGRIPEAGCLTASASVEGTVP